MCVGNDTGDAPRRRRWPRAAGWTLAVMAVAAIALFYWRVPLAEAALRAGLAAAGFTDPRIAVESLSLRRIRIARFALPPELDIAGLTLDLSLEQFRTRPVVAVAVRTLAVDLTRPDGPLRRRLTARTANGRSTAPPLRSVTLLNRLGAIPALSIDAWRLRLPVNANVLALSGNALSQTDRRGGQTATIAMSGMVQTGDIRLDLDARAFLDVGEDGAALTLKAAAPQAGATVDVGVTLAGLRSAPTARGDATLRIAELGRLSPVLPQLAGVSGTARLRARTGAPVALGGPLPDSAAALAALLCRGDHTELELTADGLRRAGIFDGLGGILTAQVRCDSASDATAEIGVNLSAARFAAAGASASEARLVGPLRAHWQAAGLTLDLPAPLTLSARRLAAPTAQTGPLRAVISAAKPPALRLALDGLRPGAARFDLAAALEPLAITVPAGDGPAVKVRLSSARLTASGRTAGDLAFALDAARADVTRGDIALGISGIKGLAARPERTAALAFDIASRLDTAMAGKKLLASLDLKLGGKLRDSALDFAAAATGPAGLSLSAKGRHDIAAGAGRADVALARLRFGAGGARLADFLPGPKPYELRSGALEAAPYELRSGALEAAARLGWGGGKVDGSADVTVADMEIADPEGKASIQGLAARMRFDRLWPPVTAPGQEITARRISAGATLDDFSVRFALRPGRSPPQPVIAIDALRAGFAGGTITGRGIVYDPARAANRALVRLRNVDLEKLLDVAKVEGLSGTGLLSGTIPVRMEGGVVAIDKGELAAAGPGLLRFKSDAARKALESGGKYVTLALQALEDFRYSKLSIGIDKAPAGEGSVLLHVEGHNPAVMDSQPFAINLNVSGNVDRLAGILARLTLLPEEIVRSIVPKK